MRRPVSLGYLLARASDTLADTEAAPVAERIGLLRAFAVEIGGGEDGWRRDGLRTFVERQDHAGERVLLERLDDCFTALAGLPPAEAAAVGKVVAVITGGQALDLERFAGRDAGQVIALASEAELDDYCYRVAGCVGAFWTETGFLTLGRGFSRADPARLEEWGIAYGKALQLINILRDFPEDLANGRCYLPAKDPRDRGELTALHALWCGRAREGLERGKSYATELASWRLRMATVLPALVGEKTLDLLDSQPGPPVAKVKIGRAQVRRALWQGLWWPAATSGR